MQPSDHTSPPAPELLPAIAVSIADGLATIILEPHSADVDYGRGNLGRVPTFSQVDLLLQQEFRLPHGMRATIALNASNVFDQKTVTGYQTTPYRDQFNVSDATFFNGFDPVAVATSLNFRKDARFNMANGFQDVRVIRLQPRVSF